MRDSKQSPLGQYAGAAAIIVAASFACLALRDRLQLIDIAMLLLLAVVVIATRVRRGPALLASVLSMLLFDLLFVPPYYTLDIGDARYLPTFVVMLAVAITMSRLTGMVREQGEAAAGARAAIEAEQLRTALLSSLSHDLRTPLGTIEGAATVLAADAGALSPGERRELAEAVVDESHRLAQLVTNLLDMMRLETGALAVHRSWQPLEECLGVALIRLEPLIGSDRVAVALPHNLPLVSVDEVLLEQVFVNLLENAARYSPAHAAIRVSAAHTGATVTVEVADDGPGIAPDEREAVFRKFYRATPAGVTPPSGSGLGLAICRGIVTAHGGRIWVERSANGGAAFRFTLPLDVVPGAAVPAEAEAEAV